MFAGRHMFPISKVASHWDPHHFTSVLVLITLPHNPWLALGRREEGKITKVADSKRKMPEGDKKRSKLKK